MAEGLGATGGLSVRRSVSAKPPGSVSMCPASASSARLPVQSPPMTSIIMNVDVAGTELADGINYSDIFGIPDNWSSATY